MSVLLDVEDLSVTLPSPRGPVRAVDGVSLSLARGRALGVVGESGSGKTMLSRAVLRLLPRKAQIRGRIGLAGRDLLSVDRRTLRELRGREMAVVFQDPMTSLNPVLNIGTQITETLREHFGTPRGEALGRAESLLGSVGIPEPARRLRQFPHELSGGMRQRVAIAIALACEPKLLIADEPTTALDVTVQAQILDLLDAERRRRAMALMLITHDLGVVAGRTDEVMVMYAGRVMERTDTRTLFRDTRHPYTEALLGAIPRLDGKPHEALAAIPGAPPDPTRLPLGCPFEPRCPHAEARCREPQPVVTGAAAAAHEVACWRAATHEEAGSGGAGNRLEGALR